MRLVVATLLLAGQAAAYFDDGLAQSDSMTPLPVIDPETGKRVLGEWTKLRPRSRLRTLEDVATFAAASAARDGRFVIGFFKAADPELSETAVPDWEEDAAFQKFNAAADLTPGVQMGVVANVEVARALNVPRLPFTVLMSQVLTRPRIFELRKTGIFEETGTIVANEIGREAGCFDMETAKWFAPPCKRDDEPPAPPADEL